MTQLTAKNFIRKLRGGSQAHLIEASDGGFYAVKFLNNPQHRRILVNEFVGHEILTHLQIATARCELLEVPEAFLRENLGAFIQLRSGRQIPESGPAFGSRCPVNPDATAIYDCLPDSLLTHVHNLRDFLGALVFDKWVGNTDGRQVIFLRALLNEWLPQRNAGSRRKGFVVLMIDNGFIFNGPEWNFVDSPISGLYPRRLVYQSVESLDAFEPWLERVSRFPEEILVQAVRHIPSAWIKNDEKELERLIKTLLRRKHIIHELVEQSYAAFPNWTNGCHGRTTPSIP